MRLKQSGQGLIESLAIILFVSVSVVALVKFQHYLAYSNDVTQQQSYANIIATNKMEQLRDFQVVNATSGYNAYADITNGSSTTTLGGVSYTVTWTVATNATPAYKTINVAVTWTDRIGTTQTVRLVSTVDNADPGTATNII